MKLKLYAAVLLVALTGNTLPVRTSGSGEATVSADDPLSDNTDVYAFKSPANPNKIILIANYIPFQLPQGSPDASRFSENVRYEIHIDNNTATPGDDIIYRFSFSKVNEDPATFFTIRLGKENGKTTYRLDRSIDGGSSFQTIITSGKVPPPYIGYNSIYSSFGLNTNYESLMTQSIMTASSGERVFCGPVDDPFFMDRGGFFDLANAPRQGPNHPEDALKCLNVASIAIEADISLLQKDHKSLSQAVNILDPSFVIGVWASASRQQTRVLNTVSNHGAIGYDWDVVSSNPNELPSGPWIQVSRAGMPLASEVIIPVGNKDLWNRLTPYQDLASIQRFGNYFYNPELGLYMDDAKLGGSVPAFAPLRMQKNSLGQFGFGNGQDGFYSLKGTSAVAGTALDDAIFGTLLLPGPGRPRSADLYPIFNTGLPNLRPYHLATGKTAGNPLAAGKPFINNFLPNGGDMLRLNMAVPATPRYSPDFSNQGLLKAIVLGLTDTRFNTTAALQFIPNMDGFPNGRRLEDDVTRIELQMVSGFVLAGMGLWYDDFTVGGNPITPALLNVLNYKTGVGTNDIFFRSSFPFEQKPWPGNQNCSCFPPFVGRSASSGEANEYDGSLTFTDIRSSLAVPDIVISASPNPFTEATTIQYALKHTARITIAVYDVLGKELRVLVNKKQEAGNYYESFNGKGLGAGVYFIKITSDGTVMRTLKIIKG